MMNNYWHFEEMCLLQLQFQAVQGLPLRNVYPEKCTKLFETSVAIYQPTGSNVNKSLQTSIAMTLWIPERVDVLLMSSAK